MPHAASLKEALEKRGVVVLDVDLSVHENWSSLYWNKIKVVDLSNMRGCLTSFETYVGIMDRMNDFIERQEHSITVIPAYRDIIWISSKSRYLDHLHKQNIPLILTLSLSRLKNPDQSSIIAEPDNIDGMIDQIKNFMSQSDKKIFVLKPSTSSLARGLRFIELLDENIYKLVIPRENSKPHTTSYYGYDNFSRDFLIPYFIDMTSYDQKFLFQEYINNIEISAIFINETPHFVKRTQGSDSRIAHARFGGTDTVITNPPPEAINLVRRVMCALPPNIRSSSFLRIDVMQDLDTGHYLVSEIEGAGATRLWLQEANRVDDYAQMLVKLGTRRPFIVNDNHLKTAPSQQNNERYDRSQSSVAVLA